MHGLKRFGRFRNVPGLRAGRTDRIKVYGMYRRVNVKRTLTAGLAVVFLLIMAAIGAGQPDAFAGKWLTDFGPMELTISGNEVNGTYGKTGGVITGTVSDDGTTLLGWWSESPTHQAPEDGGAMILTLEADGNRFAGTRWHGPSSGPGEEWKGIRVR